MNSLYKELNSTPQHFNSAMEVLAKKRKGLTYNIDNISDDHGRIVGIVKDNILIVSEENKHDIPVGNYNAFNVLLLAYNYNVQLTDNEMRTITKADFPYVRVGTDFYKKGISKDRYQIKRTELLKWTVPIITMDHGKGAASDVPRYDQFIIEPSNINYESQIDGCYNLYSQFEHEPSISPGEWETTENLIRHIWGDQYDLGLEYMQNLFLAPRQALPVLVLVSEERGTGKSTFIFYLDQLFGANTVVVNPQDISSNFNDSYAIKNIIGIEESRFDSAQTMEKIKNLATQQKILVNPKGVTPYSVPFFGKLIITSNEERKFSKIDQGEVRYWIRKVPSLNGITNIDILEDLKAEIPYFLRYLQSEMPELKPRDRAYFKPSETHTEALDIVKDEGYTPLYKDMYARFEDAFNDDVSLEEIEFTPLDIRTTWYDHDKEFKTSYIMTVLKDEFRLNPSNKPCKYRIMGNDKHAPKKTGRAYTIKRDYFTDVAQVQEQEKKEGDCPF